MVSLPAVTHEDRIRAFAAVTKQYGRWPKCPTCSAPYRVVKVENGEAFDAATIACEKGCPGEETLRMPDRVRKQ